MGFEMKKTGFSKQPTSKPVAKTGFSMQGGGVDDPLADVDYTDNLAEDCGREFEALQKGFKARAKAERDRFTRATDSEFWFAVCFETREEKEAFLRAAGVKKQIMGDKYLDGRKLAQVLKINMD